MDSGFVLKDGMVVDIKSDSIDLDVLDLSKEQHEQLKRKKDVIYGEEIVRMAESLKGDETFNQLREMIQELKRDPGSGAFNERLLALEAKVDKAEGFFDNVEDTVEEKLKEYLDEVSISKQNRVKF